MKYCGGKNALWLYVTEILMTECGFLDAKLSVIVMVVFATHVQWPLQVVKPMT
jgi:hypothetical protein